jgi:hypothetical protein
MLNVVTKYCIIYVANRLCKGSIMSKVSVSVFATMLASVLTLSAVSCMGPNYHPPVAAGGTPILASAAVPGAGATPAVAAASPWNGSGIFAVGAILGLACLGTSMYIFRAKPD